MPSSNTTINSESLLFSDLFGKGSFAVPWHQRYYDWKKTDVSALLYDINEAVEESRICYFLGTIMLVKPIEGTENQKKIWEINDGQQRMITLSLIFATLCKKFADEGDAQREGIALKMLFNLKSNDVCNLSAADQYAPRITPPQNDITHYNQIIRGRTIGSNSRLSDACKEIETFFSLMSYEKAKNYFEFLTDKLEIVCLFIPTVVDTNAIYETINCRGKKIDDFDLIRNYIYSHFKKNNDNQRRESIHENLERVRNIIPRALKAFDYIRCHLQCEFGFLQKDFFYRDVRDAIRKRNDKEIENYIFNLTNKITSFETLQLFLTITAKVPEPNFVQKFRTDSGFNKSPRHLGTFLQELQSYKVTHPLIFAMLNRYITEKNTQQKKHIAKIAHKNISRLTAFVLRTAFVVSKFEPSLFEKKFSNYAEKISKANEIPDSDFAYFLKNCDESQNQILIDSNFKKLMSESKMNHSNQIKSFLLGVNSGIQKDSPVLNRNLVAIEHILPKSEKHWDEWINFEGQAGEYINRIGNLTLMSSTDNQPSLKDNANYEKKRQKYKDSAIKITRDLIEYSDWKPEFVESRQKNMIKLATKVWAFKDD